MEGVSRGGLCAEAKPVVKDNRGMACERDSARFNGAMWFFGHDRDSLIVSRYDGTIREITRTQLNLIVNTPVVVDGKGRFWVRAKPYMDAVRATASWSMPMGTGFTTQLKRDSRATVFTT